MRVYGSGPRGSLQKTGVELIRYRRPEGARPKGLGVPHTRGLRHVAFQVEDLDAAVRALQAAGARLLGEPQVVAADQVSYSSGKRLVYCQDPEGNLLELCAYGG